MIGIAAARPSERSRSSLTWRAATWSWSSGGASFRGWVAAGVDAGGVGEVLPGGVDELVGAGRGGGGTLRAVVVGAFDGPDGGEDGGQVGGVAEAGDGRGAGGSGRGNHHGDEQENRREDHGADDREDGEEPGHGGSMRVEWSWLSRRAALRRHVTGAGVSCALIGQPCRGAWEMSWRF